MRIGTIPTKKKCIPGGWLLIMIILMLGRSSNAQEQHSEPEHRGQMQTFDMEKEVKHLGKTYQLGRLLPNEGTYGRLTLRIRDDDGMRDQLASPVQYLEISKVEVLRLKGRPFFFVTGRHQLFLVDMEGEKIAPYIRPGVNVAYGDDAISGQMNGFQFFDGGNYLLGIAVSYGVFCFNISDLDHPKELLRYSSDFSDQGQPYFFLEQNADGTCNGIVSQSDTTKKSTHISRFYTKTKPAKYLFRNARLAAPPGPYADPSDYETGHPEPFLLLKELGSDVTGTPWVIDLKQGKLLQGKQARRFMEKQP